LFSCPVAQYLDDWIQMGLLFPCSSRKMDDAIFNFYTIPKVRAKSSSCLYWWRVESRQIVDKQTSWIDHTFDCSLDHWQWYNGSYAQLHNYLDDWIQMRLLFPCSLWKMVDAIFNFYTIPKVRAKSSSCLYWWRVESSRVESRQIVDKQTSWIDHTFDCSLDYWQWSICVHAQVAHYLDDWIQMRLLFPCSSRKMDDAMFTLYTIPKVRAKSSSCLYWWRVDRVQKDCWQTSLIDVTFDCSSDYWQWSNCSHVQLHNTLTTEFRWDCSFRVVQEKWMMPYLISTQFPR